LKRRYRRILDVRTSAHHACWWLNQQDFCSSCISTKGTEDRQTVKLTLYHRPKPKSVDMTYSCLFIEMNQTARISLQISSNVKEPETKSTEMRRNLLGAPRPICL